MAVKVDVKLALEILIFTSLVKNICRVQRKFKVLF